MHLKTIWTLRGMSLAERARRTGECVVRATAHRLPRRLAYWSFIDTGVRLIKGNEVVPEVRYMDLLQRFPHRQPLTHAAAPACPRRPTDATTTDRG